MVLTVILGIAVVCSPGYVYWQNFIQKKTTSGTSIVTTNKVTKETVVQSNNQKYTDEYFSFDYPKKGWSVSKENTSGERYQISIKTSDYQYIQANPPETIYGGVSVGASIHVYLQISQLAPIKSLNDSIKSSESKGLIENVTSKIVDGQTAYSYQSSYEWDKSRKTSFEKNGKLYGVFYHDANIENWPNQSTYQLIVNSLHIE